MERAYKSIIIGLVGLVLCMLSFSVAQAQSETGAGKLVVYANGSYEVWGGYQKLGYDGYNIDLQEGYVKLGESTGNAVFPGGYKYYVVATHMLYSLDAIQLPNGTYPERESYVDGEYLTWGNVHLPYQFRNPPRYSCDLIGSPLDYAHDDDIYGPPDGLTDDVGHPPGCGTTGERYEGFVVVESPLDGDPSGMQVDMSYLYYKDDAGREINYDFSSGTINANKITIPDSAILQRPLSEVGATYLWEHVGNGDLSLSINTTAKVCTLHTNNDGTAAIGANFTGNGGGGGGNNWQFSVSLKNFIFTGMGDHGFSIGGGSSSSAISPSIEAGWFTGWHEGNYYDNVFYISAEIEDDFDHNNSWSSQTFLLYGIDPITTTADFNVEVQNGRSFIASYRINGGQWVEVGRHSISSGSMTSFDAILPYVSISTDTVSPTNNCTATLSGDFNLHIPIVNFNDNQAYYWADFSYVPGTLDFTLTNAGIVSDVSSFSSCAPSILSSDFKLHIPAVTFGSASYWADLQYARDLLFTLTGAGQN